LACTQPTTSQSNTRPACVGCETRYNVNATTTATWSTHSCSPGGSASGCKHINLGAYATLNAGVKRSTLLPACVHLTLHACACLSSRPRPTSHPTPAPPHPSLEHGSSIRADSFVRLQQQTESRKQSSYSKQHTQHRALQEPETKSQVMMQWGPLRSAAQTCSGMPHKLAWTVISCHTSGCKHIPIDQLPHPAYNLRSSSGT
jgi:hypothetical protein